MPVSVKDMLKLLKAIPPVTKHVQFKMNPEIAQWIAEHDYWDFSDGPMPCDAFDAMMEDLKK